MLRKPTTFAPVKSKDIISGMMNTVKKVKTLLVVRIMLNAYSHDPLKIS